MTTTNPSTPLTRAERAALLAGAGIVAMIAARFTDSTAADVAAIALLGVAALMGMSAGWFVGLTPRAAVAPASLVGARIGFGSAVFTVLDDSAPSAAAALRGGGRCSVVAVDATGRVGVLFVGMDRHGRVIEAATETRDWAPARPVGWVGGVCRRRGESEA